MSKVVDHVRITETKIVSGISLVELTATNTGAVLGKMVLEGEAAVDLDAKIAEVKGRAARAGITFIRFSLEFV